MLSILSEVEMTKRYKLLPIEELKAKAKKAQARAETSCRNWLIAEQELKALKVEIRLRKGEYALLP